MLVKIFAKIIQTYQLTAAGFLSEQKLPLKLKTSMSGKYPSMILRDSSVPCYRKIQINFHTQYVIVGF